MEAGEACIRYLRENRVGRVNLICLDRVAQQLKTARQRNFEAPNNSHRLFDLINFKEDKF